MRVFAATAVEYAVQAVGHRGRKQTKRDRERDRRTREQARSLLRERFRPQERVQLTLSPPPAILSECWESPGDRYLLGPSRGGCRDRAEPLLDALALMLATFVGFQVIRTYRACCTHR